MMQAQPAPAVGGRLRGLWSDPERLAWRVPEPILPSQWAERHRRLTRNQSNHSGPWENSWSPYSVGLMNLAVRPGVEEINLQKAAQIGASEAFRNVLAYFAHTDPDPMLFVMPDEQAGKSIVAKRLFPLFRTTPTLRELLTRSSRDLKLNQITLSNGFMLKLAWSGSPSTLATDPIRRVLDDEVDKFPSWSGRESDPVSLARIRTQTYGNRRLVINLSTPTTRAGLIAKLVEDSDIILRYFVPCPHCGKYQVLAWDHVRFPDEIEGISKTDKKAMAKRFDEQPELVHYECAHCKGEIHDHHKPVIVNQGCWATDDMAPTLRPPEVDGYIPGDVHPNVPRARIVGAMISCLPCIWITFAAVAAEYLRSLGDLAKMMNWRNSWMGEVFEEQIQRAEASVFAIKCRESKVPPAKLPRWTGRLIASADTQADHFKFVIRAWSAGFRSHRVLHGRVNSFEELYEVCLATPFEWLDAPYAPITAEKLFIDSGGTKRIGEELSRTEQVYRFSMLDPLRIHCCKGESEPIKGMPIRLTRGNYQPKDSSTGMTGEAINEMALRLWLIDTEYFKDLLSVKVHERMDAVDVATGELIEGVETWALNTANDAEYNAELSAEHKIIVRRGKKAVERWQPITAGAANHFLDAEVLNYAGAYVERIDVLEPPPVIDAERQRQVAERTRLHNARMAEQPPRKFDRGDGRSFIARKD